MFVKTVFETIVNLANCDRIELDFYKKRPTDENSYHEIRAVFGNRDERDREKVLIHFQITPKMTEEERNQVRDLAQNAYNNLYLSLFNGDNTFDMYDAPKL